MLLLKRGDITKMAVGAIVNAANISLLGGGGVDGAIHRAAGPELLEECRLLGGAKTGEAKITKGYRLPAKFVIHTPGPIFNKGCDGEATLLASCYRESLARAVENGVETIAFPYISTGAYGYPKKEAAEIAVKTVLDHFRNPSCIKDVFFVVFSEEDYEIYASALEKMDVLK